MTPPPRHNSTFRAFIRICAVAAVLVWISVIARAAVSLQPAGSPKTGPACTLDPILDLQDLKRIIPGLSRAGVPHTGDLPEMRKRKVIRVLTDYSKTNYFLEDGHFQGHRLYQGKIAAGNRHPGYDNGRFLLFPPYLTQYSQKIYGG